MRTLVRGQQLARPEKPIEPTVESAKTVLTPVPVIVITNRLSNGEHDMNAAGFVNSVKYAIVSYRAPGYRQDVDWAMCPGVKLPFSLDLPGKVDGNGGWRWNRHDEPWNRHGESKDWSKRATVNVTIRDDQAE